METFVAPSSPLEPSASASTVDELTMQQSLLFSDSLEDLKTLRSQLYSAAEYFESTYTNDDQKEMYVVVNTLKDYAVKALVNTVDHLGSISFKVNGLLHRKFDEVSETELRVSCIERRIRTCQEHTDRQGLSQQSLVITAPKFYKRYTLPVGGSMPESGSQAVPKHQELDRFQDSAEAHQFQAEIRQKTKDKPPSFRKLRSIRIKHSQRARSSSPAQKVRSQSPSSQPAKVADKRADSPIPTSNPVTHSGSIVRKPSLLKSSSVGVQYPSETQKLASMRLHAERTDDKDGKQNPNKGRKFLKSLLSRRKSRKDEMLYSYLDEY
ncbi:putative protein ABIL2 isoform X3 [Ananas comosus]|uniref:Protein ABIL3 n=1 Tax=Ananas comosus TaxID=4615 RepID=A0A6P5GB89_ANACO|nr:putative protein ABIL2 isoform X3 [Ananas comosus]